MREEAETVLRALAGPGAVLREDQWSAISALVQDRSRALVVQRTGWGKSAVYFVATALLRARGAGPTVIISPLLALMRNQVAAAERAGISGVTVNSSNVEQWQQTYDEIAAGRADVLLVSPERLNNPGFHGFSEMLYEYTSSSANNGSGFEGLGDNNPFWNITTGMVLILSRYLPIIGPLAIAGILANKKYVPESAGTLPTDTATFGAMVLAVIVIIAALAFFPALVLGPLAEFFAVLPPALPPTP